ncbi:MAG: protein kinase [Candidatus Krumholzibacteriota bacterium]
MIGRTVSNYRVLAKIDSGSSGAVYKAEHLTLGVPVALKFIHPEYMYDPDNRIRFAREARAAAKLDHTSICKVFDYGEYEDGAFIAMDFVDGQNLREVIAEGPVDLDDAVLIAIQIAEGLEQAHHRGIVHRDIKPSNLMVASPDNGRSQVKILDFGIARSLDTTRVTRSGGVVGTASYMSPEQAMGQEVDFRTDLWSLGTCLYQMVTGRVPFQGDYEHAIQYAVINSQPTPVGTLRPDARPELRRIINKSLNKNPADRYQSASEMLVDLRNLRREISTVLPPLQGWIWKYRNRLTLGTGAILILTLLAILFGPLFRPKIEANPFEKGSTRRVTHSAAWEAEPKLSPDGNLIAFTSNAEGNLDIYWVGLAGGDPVRLTDDPADDSEPCWLADGSGIAFTSTRRGGPGIWKTDLTGRATSLLLEDALHPALSPDGRKIAFTRLDDHGSGRIFVADLDDPSNATRLTGHKGGYWSHRYPAWSPDSKTICYGDFHNLWVVPARGGLARPLTEGGGGDNHPVYSPDGRCIYFASFRDGDSALWRTDSKGDKLLKLTPGSGPESHPELDRGGNALVYSTQTRHRDLVLTDFRNGRTALMESPTRDYQPCLSPDGSLLAFVSMRWNSNADLWVQQLVDGEPVGSSVRLVDQEGSVSHPAISPDNRWVAYYLIQQEIQQRDIWIAPIPAGRPIRITAHPAADVSPIWSPDGRTLAFSSDRDGIQAVYTIPVVDGEAAGPPTRITPLVHSINYPAWSPDGSEILFQALKEGTTETWVVPVDGSSPPRALTHQADTYIARWVWDRNEIWACGKWDGPEYEIRRVHLDGAPASPLDPPLLMGPDNEYPSFCPDRWGNLMVHTVDEMKGDIWILEAEEDTRF